jgi:hypothetical protein
LIDNPDVHQVVLRNNLVSGNLLFQIALEAKLPEGTVQIDHNLIDGGGADFDGATTGEDSVSGDPQLADPSGGDYRLTAGSPAVDQASPDLAPDVDYDGTSRPQGAAPDIGAFEF